MNKEQQRIRIAEACGVKPEFVEWWAYKDDDTGGRICMSNVDKSVVEKWIADNPEYAKGYVAKPYYRYPRYDEDLNAMHEAKKILSDSQKRKWGELCVEMTNDFPQHIVLYCKNSVSGENIYTVANLTAAQEAELLLKTLGLWKEEA